MWGSQVLDRLVQHSILGMLVRKLKGELLMGREAQEKYGCHCEAFRW